MKHVLVSACLLGMPCRYDGRSKPTALTELSRAAALVPFCPEIYGGLATPREPAEILHGRVVAKSGTDVTEQYRKGAKETVRLAKMLGCDCAVLQDRSPSCGRGMIHNGNFDGGLIPGDGIAARALLEAGIPVYSASEVLSAGRIPQP